MIYGYARVSTKGQAKDGNSLNDQENKLKEHGATFVYKEAFTGTKTNRPEFNKLLAKLEPGDTLMVTKLDRFARSASQGAALIQELLDKDITVDILNMGRLNNTSTGKLITTIFLAFAEFERDCIVERTQSGKEIAKESEDYKEGRPKRVYTKQQIKMIKQMLERGESKNCISKTMNIPYSSLTRLIDDIKGGVV